MPRVCVVCKQQQSHSLTVFRFPSSIDQQATWVRLIRSVITNFAKSEDDMRNQMRNGICEMHFDKKDFNRGRLKCRLKTNAIPLVATFESKFVNSPNENKYRHKFTQTDSFGNMQQLESDFGEERKITVCTLCRNSDISYGHRLNDCEKSVLHVVSEVCLLDRTTYESEICLRCIGIIREIVEFKNEIKIRMQLLLNLTNGVNITNWCNEEKFNLCNTKFDRMVMSVGSKIITANKKSDFVSQGKKKTSFKCSACLKIFYARHLYLLHEASHKKCFDCVICGRFLTTKARLQQHLYKFHCIGEPKKQMYTCSSCEKAFSTKPGLKYHKSVLHNSHILYPCEKCDKSFKSNLLLKSHLLFAHGQKSVPCEFCLKKFFTVSKRNVHVNTVHRNASSWVCHVCNSKFTSNTSFRHHVRAKHHTDHYKCEYCLSEFKKKSSLKNHLCKQNSFKCPKCSISFSEQDALNIHESECQKNSTKNSFLHKYDCGLTMFDGVNYTENGSVQMESIEVLGVLDKSDGNDPGIANDIPLVNVHLLNEISTSHGQSMQHSIEPLYHTDMFESDLSRIQENVVTSEINCLPLHQNDDKINNLVSRPEHEENVDMSVIETHRNQPSMLPLHQGGEVELQNISLHKTVRSEMNTSNLHSDIVVDNVDDIEFHRLHFSQSTEEGTHSIPLQEVIDLEIPAISLEANDDHEINDLSHTQGGNSGIVGLSHTSDELGDLSFDNYHERTLPLESSLDHKSFQSNVLSEHLVQIDGESEICSMDRDKDWNLPIILDNNDVHGMSFRADITPTIDIPMCEESRALVDANVSLGNDLSEFTLPEANTNQPHYVIDYLIPSDDDVK